MCNFIGLMITCKSISTSQPRVLAGDMSIASEVQTAFGQTSFLIRSSNSEVEYWEPNEISEYAP